MKPKLVAFDMDGVLVKFEGADNSWDLIRSIYGIPSLWKDYRDGKLTREEARDREYAFWREKGITESGLRKELAGRFTFVEGAEEVVKALKEGGVAVAIISDGVCMVAEEVARKLGVRDFACNRIVFGEDGFAKDTQPTHPAPNIMVSKALALREFAAKAGVGLDECAVVGNTKEDIEMLREAGFSVAFDPRDDEVRGAANVVVESRDLKDILEHLQDSSGKAE